VGTDFAVSALLLAAEGEPSPLKPHTAEIIVGLVAFVLLFLFLRAKVFPVFERIYQERTEAIEGGISRAEQAQAEAQAALEQYRSQLAEARTEAARIREEAAEQGRAIIEEMRRQAQEEAARITARADQEIAATRQQTVTELRSEIGRLATDLAGRLVGESLESDVARRRTVDRFLAELDGGVGAGSTR
jgi:F-type H+-transporting ATPase subunit b